MIPDNSPIAEHTGGEGPPLLLLHGLMCGWRVWAPVLPELERHHRVIAPTLAGHRGAVALGDGIRAGAAALTDVVEARLDRLGIERVDIAGNSLGGWIALELARRGRARSVVALSPAGSWNSEVGVEKLAMRFTLERMLSRVLHVSHWPLLRSAAARRVLLAPWMEHAERLSPAAAAEMLQDVEGCAAFDDIVAALRRDGPIAEPIDPPDCRIRIGWGQQDRVIPLEPYGRLMLAAVPSAELVVLPGVGHVPMYDDASLIARTILEVTANNAAAAPPPR